MAKTHWNVTGQPACDYYSPGRRRVIPPKLTMRPDEVDCRMCERSIGMTDRPYEEVMGYKAFDSVGG